MLMVIGIDASRAFLKRRTGIEEYAYQVISHLRHSLPSDVRVILYVRKKIGLVDGRIVLQEPIIDFPLPEHWRVRALWAPRFWTQAALSLEMFFHAPDVLFVPAHTVPIIHPRKTVVAIHGLEYEFCQEAYSRWERIYMHFSIMYSCKVASTVISVSENTKRDVMKLYQVAVDKIRVVYEGYESKVKISPPKADRPWDGKPHLLFIGRLETRKNIVRILEAFEILKEKYQIPHRLVLAGKPGYSYEKIRLKMEESRYKNEVHEVGYVTEEEKWELLKNADVFLFPTLYEGFGIPVLEAQSVGVPVVTSNTSSLPEVAGEGAIFVDPTRPEQIALGVKQLLSDETLRSGIIEKAAHNVNRYSWASCAQNIARILTQEI